MNVVITNKRQSLLENLGIDIIKELHGEYTVEEIVNTFQNFFYQRMILDLTAIKGYEDISTIQSLASSLNMSKVILILDGTTTTNNRDYISKLISLGIYNFTDNLKGIEYLYNYPNSYDDVAKYHNSGDNFTNVSSENNEIDYNSNKEDNDNNNSKKNGVFFNNDSSDNSYSFFGGKIDSEPKIIGIKNLTRESGATSLTYMMVKALNKKYKTIGIEIDKNDLTYFKDNNYISITSDSFESSLKKYDSYDVIVVDLNDAITCESLCNDVLYLIEPSIIKLQKLISLNKNALHGYKNKKVILNQSLLDERAINTFEFESGLKIFYNLKPLNERENNYEDLNKLLAKLGFSKLK